MSVLNDVLKNIDEQKAQQRRQFMEKTYGPKNQVPGIIWVTLSAMGLAICALTGAVLMMTSTPINVPYDLYDTLQAVEVVNELDDSKKNKSTTAAIEVPVTKEEGVSSIQALPSTQNIVRKTEATEAEEDGIAALKAGKTEQVKKILTKAQPRMRENLNLRVMLKESPEKVVPYLQSNNPDFISNDELLALAAQAQQRAGEHKMAIVYYQQLIQRQPHEARWLAGLAISLDGLGENDKAKSIYQSVLQTGALPPPLKRFVNYRLKHLGG